MAFTFNPQNLASMDITDPKQAKVFVLQLSRILQEALNSQGIASLVNGSASITENALQIVNTNLGSVSTNQTVECGGATSIYVQLSFTAAITLTMAHVSAGAQVFVRVTNGSAGALFYKMACSDAAGTAQTVFAIFSTAGGELNMTTTGISMAAGLIEYYQGVRPGAMLLLSL